MCKNVHVLQMSFHFAYYTTVGGWVYPTTGSEEASFSVVYLVSCQPHFSESCRNACNGQQIFLSFLPPLPSTHCPEKTTRKCPKLQHTKRIIPSPPPPLLSLLGEEWGKEEEGHSLFSEFSVCSRYGTQPTTHSRQNFRLSSDAEIL